MNYVTGTMTRYAGKGTVVSIPLSSIKGFSIGLLDGYQWDIGIDQSTTCTGFCIQSSNREYQILLDVYRDRALQKNVFYQDLFFLLKNTVSDKNIRMVIMERPAPKAMYASRVLEELKGHVEEWILQISEMKHSVVDSLYPQTWKSFMVDKSKGKNRSNVKRCVAEDICDRFPLLRDYFFTDASSGYDSFDACGILNGYLEYAYTSNGSEKIHGVKEKRHTSLVGYVWVSKDSPSAVVSSLGKYGFEIFKPHGLVYNDRFSLHDNIRMASSNYECSCTVIPPELLDQFMWKYGIDPSDDSKMLLMFALNKGRINAANIKYFKDVVPWNEEVYDK